MSYDLPNGLGKKDLRLKMNMTEIIQYTVNIFEGINKNSEEPEISSLIFKRHYYFNVNFFLNEKK